MSGKTLYLVRHGFTETQRTKVVILDDPLADKGKQGADKLGQEWGSQVKVDVVLVSPLTRALDTCVRVFAGRTELPLVVEPLLREFNPKQTADKTPVLRHVGHTTAELKQAFPQPNLVWPADVADDAPWWKPWGDFAPSSHSSGPPSVVERLQRAAQVIMDRKEQHIAVVAHEGVYRCLAGVFQVANCAVVECDVTTLPLPSSVPTLCAHQSYKFPPLLPKVIPLQWARLAAAAAGHVVVVLGCSNFSVLTHRVHHGLSLMLRDDRPLLFVGSAREFLPFRKAVSQYIDPSTGQPLTAAQLTRVLHDSHSRYTECNVEFTALVLHAARQALIVREQGQPEHKQVQANAPAWRATDGKWHAHVVTSDWHSPRSMLTFRKELRRLKLQQWLALHCASAPTTHEQRQKLSLDHQQESLILCFRVLANRHQPRTWKTVRRECKEELRVLRQMYTQSLRAVSGDNPPSLSAADKDRLVGLLQQGDEQLPAVCKLLAQLGKSGIDGVKAVDALHVSARVNAPLTCEALVYFFGAKVEALDALGKTPLDYTKTKDELKKQGDLWTAADQVTRASTLLWLVTQGKEDSWGRYCQWEHHSACVSELALPGVHSTWITPTVVASQRLSTRLLHQQQLVTRLRPEFGIHLVLNLQQPGEHPWCSPDPLGPSGFTYEPELLRQHGVEVTLGGWLDHNTPPVPHLHELVASMLRCTGKILVHCHAGLGRTGTVIAAYMMVQGSTAAEAIQHIRDLRPHSINPRQEAFLKGLDTLALRALAKQS